MKYSIINVYEQRGDRVDGNWLQDYTGTLKSAKVLIKEINAVNSNRLNLAIVELISCVNPILHYFTDLKIVR